jgi:hypothetical protein
MQDNSATFNGYPRQIGWFIYQFNEWMFIFRSQFEIRHKFITPVIEDPNRDVVLSAPSSNSLTARSPLFEIKLPFRYIGGFYFGHLLLLLLWRLKITSSGIRANMAKFDAYFEEP